MDDDISGPAGGVRTPEDVALQEERPYRFEWLLVSSAALDGTARLQWRRSEGSMRIPFTLIGSCLVLGLLVSACGGPPPSRLQGETAAITPLAPEREEGTLVVGVLGFPREIQYFINGVHIEPEEEIPWWDDARLTVNLRPGDYKVEAKYRVRAFAGEKTEYRIVTSSPVSVRAGQTAYLLARIEKDWRGVPASMESHFGVVTASEFESRVQEARATWVASSAEAGLTPGEQDQMQAAPSGAAGSRADSAAAAAAPSFVIRGNQIVPPGSSMADTSQGPVGLPSAAEPQPENLAFPAPATPAPGSDLQLSVLVESEPSGARVFLDEQALGETPLRISLDPTADHLLRFQHENCSDHVQIVSAESWEDGRSTTISTKLDCP